MENTNKLYYDYSIIDIWRTQTNYIMIIVLLIYGEQKST
jgi:hypothetical protein